MSWRALTLKQPWPWAIVHAGKNVENRTWPVPPKLFASKCSWCRGLGVDPGAMNQLLGPDCPVCGASGREPLRVMVHAGAQWDFGAFPSVSNAARWALLADGTRVMSWKRKDVDNNRTWTVKRSKAGSQDESPYGAVVAVATITGSHSEWDCLTDTAGVSSCSTWAMSATNDKPMWHWELADVQPLAAPVPAKGRLGLWKPSAELIEAVESQQ